MSTGTLSPNTIGGALADATAKLTAAKIDAPKLVAQMLLAHMLGVPRANIFAYPQKQTLQSHQLTTFRGLLNRCIAGEPVAYVVGHIEFYALDFLTDRRALIPRPETEHLVELALARVKPQTLAPALRSGASAGVSNPKYQIVDVGTGCGCIVISLATHLPNTRFVATDASGDALALAHENARRHKVNARIQFLRGDLLAPVPGRVDGVVANLPYVTTPEWQNLPRHIREHEPRTALDGGPDGLDLIRRLFSQAPRYVKPDGWLLLEIGATQGPAISALARQAFPLAAVNLHRDYAGLARVVEIQFRAVPGIKIK
jgi:release factor glutamine methyltransferase